MAGQNQWYHFGVGAPPILVYYFSGDCIGCSLGVLGLAVAHLAQRCLREDGLSQVYWPVSEYFGLKWARDPKSESAIPLQGRSGSVSRCSGIAGWDGSAPILNNPAKEGSVRWDSAHGLGRQLSASLKF